MTHRSVEVVEIVIDKTTNIIDKTVGMIVNVTVEVFVDRSVEVI